MSGKGKSYVVGVGRRELGQLSGRNFAREFAATQDLVLRFDILRKLDKHKGCVNTVSFNAAGDIIVSGSDDTRIILWDWEAGRKKLSFDSGHHNNVFHAKIMPYTDDRSIVTCAADGQVRHAQILECGRVDTKLLVQHRGQTYRLALEPGSPHNFYSCGEDGAIQHIDLRTGNATCLYTCKPLHNQSHLSYISLYSIAIDPRNPNLFAVGGSDPFARLYDIRRYKSDGGDCLVNLFCPSHLIDDAHVGITGVAFSDQSELLVSYDDEFIHLFDRDMGLGLNPTLTSQAVAGSEVVDMIPGGHFSSYLSKVDPAVKDYPQFYKGHRNCETVKGVNFFGPKCEYVMSGSDCGRIFIWKKKGGELIRVLEADKYVVNCIEAHPHSTMLASCGIEHDIKIWTPEAIDKAILPPKLQKDDIIGMYWDYFEEEDVGESDENDDDDDGSIADSEDSSDGDGDDDDDSEENDDSYDDSSAESDDGSDGDGDHSDDSEDDDGNNADCHNDSDGDGNELEDGEEGDGNLVFFGDSEEYEDFDDMDYEDFDDFYDSDDHV